MLLFNDDPGIAGGTGQIAGAATAAAAPVQSERPEPPGRTTSPLTFIERPAPILLPAPALPPLQPPTPTVTPTVPAVTRSAGCSTCGAATSATVVSAPGPVLSVAPAAATAPVQAAGFPWWLVLLIAGAFALAND